MLKRLCIIAGVALVGVSAGDLTLGASSDLAISVVPRQTASGAWQLRIELE